MKKHFILSLIAVTLLSASHAVAQETSYERLKSYAEALPQSQKDVVAYLMNAYVAAGVEELGVQRLPQLLALKFGSIPEGIRQMGGPLQARETYYEAQRVLYS